MFVPVFGFCWLVWSFGVVTLVVLCGCVGVLVIVVAWWFVLQGFGLGLGFTCELGVVAVVVLLHGDLCGLGC